MTRKISFSVGEYYHLYNRGVDKRNIFANKNDYGRFTALLYLCNSSKPINISKHFDRKRSFQELFVVPRKNTLVEIVSYCLMPNHFHILVYEKRESGISRFMQKLSTAYSMYFNVKRGRTGGLFEGTFKAKHIDTNPYLLYVTSYIHLNPIKLIDTKWKENGIRDKKAARSYLHQYPYSSFLDYVGKKRKEGNIIEPRFLQDTRTPNSFEEFVGEWLSNDASDLAEVKPRLNNKQT